MAFRVRIDRIGDNGTRASQPQFFEAPDESAAILIAAYEVDNNKIRRPRVATMTSAAGRLLITYPGRYGAACE